MRRDVLPVLLRAAGVLLLLAAASGAPAAAEGTGASGSGDRTPSRGRGRGVRGAAQQGEQDSEAAKASGGGGGGGSRGHPGRGRAGGGSRHVSSSASGGGPGGGDDTWGGAVVERSKRCAPGCERRGNCNAEEGRCECPWGWSGPACEVDQLGACRQTGDDPGSCGVFLPKNCECFRACFRLYCPGGSLRRCHHLWSVDANDANCYLYGNRTAALERYNATGPDEPPPGLDPATPQDRSLFPADFNTSTIWFRQFPEAAGRSNYTQSMMLPPSEQWRVGLASGRRLNHTARPLDRCPASCSNGRGACVQWPGESSPRCLCRLGWSGFDCSAPDPSTCVADAQCGGRGTCVSGFCHCRPGWWGLGCRRSRAFQPAEAGTVPNVSPRHVLRVYMYELPWSIAFPYQINEEYWGRDPIYTADQYFLQYFLDDTVVRTENPYEANLFFLPSYTFYYAINLLSPQLHAELVMGYVNATWPFYNRSGGSDHFWFTTGDRGPCWLQRWLQDATIKVHHFGMQRANITLHDASQNKEYGCIQVKRDLVTAPINYPSLVPPNATQYYQWLAEQGGRDPNRQLLFFFAGGVQDHWPEYSGGVRQAVAHMLRNLTELPQDVLFIEGRTDNYTQLLWASKFMLVPYGFGWGLRIVQALQYGCVPVIIQDSVWQPYEDLLPYDEFAVRLPLSGVPYLLELLRTYSEYDLRRMRLAMGRYLPAFVWPREQGGRAYEWTLYGLQRRLYNRDAGLYRRRRRGRRRRQLLAQLAGRDEGYARRQELGP